MKRFCDIYRMYLSQVPPMRGLKARNMKAQGSALGLGSQPFRKP